jgi:hypothetical protein
MAGKKCTDKYSWHSNSRQKYNRLKSELDETRSSYIVSGLEISSTATRLIVYVVLHMDTSMLTQVIRSWKLPATNGTFQFEAGSPTLITKMPVKCGARFVAFAAQLANMKLKAIFLWCNTFKLVYIRQALSWFDQACKDTTYVKASNLTSPASVTNTELKGKLLKVTLVLHVRIKSNQHGTCRKKVTKHCCIWTAETAAHE